MARSRRTLALLALALVAQACAGSGPEPEAIRPPPVPTVVWPAERLETAQLRAIRGLPDVEGLGRIGAATLDLARVKGAERPLPRRLAGGVVPVSVMALDPVPLRRSEHFAPLAAALRRGEAALTETSATLRGMEIGDALRLDGPAGSAWFRVGAILPGDDLVDSEVILPLARAGEIGVQTNRAAILLVSPPAAATLPMRLEPLLDGTPARVGPLERWPERDTSILSMADIKRIFGEFSFRPKDGYYLEIDPAWVERNIFQTTLPLLGVVKCHRLILPQLAGAMRELVARGLEDVVRSEDGCWSARMQFGNRLALSRHSFGIAVDINYATNRYGEPPQQDPRLVEVMERWGFVWGGRWMIPDGMHFEFVRFAPKDA